MIFLRLTKNKITSNLCLCQVYRSIDTLRIGKNLYSNTSRKSKVSAFGIDYCRNIIHQIS